MGTEPKNYDEIAARLDRHVEESAPPPLEAYANEPAAEMNGHAEPIPPDPESIQAAFNKITSLALPSFEALCMKTIAPKIPLIRDLMYPGAWLVTGRPKIGKSWLIMQLALAIAEKETFLGYNCEVDGQVLAIFGEDDESRIQTRLRSFGVTRAPPNIHFMDRARLMASAKEFCAIFSFTEFLDSWLATRPQVRLVIVDTEVTVRLMWDAERQAAGAGRVVESDYKQTSAYDEVALRRGVVVLLINHAGKRKGETIDPHELINRSNTAFAGCSGSIALADMPDADVMDPSEKRRIFAARGRDLADDLMLVVHHDKEAARFLSDGPYRDVKQSIVEQEILGALEELMPDTGEGQYVSTDQIAESIGKRRTTVTRAVSRMIKAGHIRWKAFKVSSKRGRKGGLRLDPI